MSGFDLQEIFTLVKGLIVEANKQIPGATGPEKRAWVSERLVALVEFVDHMLPLVGKYLDLPVVDNFERYLINVLIERCYAELKLDEAVQA